jgi:hypothetical protein
MVKKENIETLFFLVHHGNQVVRSEMSELLLNVYANEEDSELMEGEDTKFLEFERYKEPAEGQEEKKLNFDLN